MTTLPEWLYSGIHLLLVLLIPYTALVALVAVFLVSLPRAKSKDGCRKCGYNLSGLNPLGLVCPECGAEQSGYRCTGCNHDLRGLDPRSLLCPKCHQPWKGPGSGRENEPEVLVPIPKRPVKKRRAI
jgi:hypothetical protein